MRRTLLLFAALIAPLVLAPPAPAADAADADHDLRTLADLERGRSDPGFAPLSGRAAQPFASTVVTANDTFRVAGYGFDDAFGNCLPRGWTGTDLVPRVYAHVSGRFTVNDGFVNMGARALWFGADSGSVGDPSVLAGWVRPFGYGNGWSQRLTSPSFSRVLHPDAVLAFDARLELHRNIDQYPTSTFSSHGLVSGTVANDLLGVQTLLADGSWAFLNGRFALAGGPAWEATVPLFSNRWGSFGGGTLQMYLPTGVATDDSGNVYVADGENHRILKFSRSGQYLHAWGAPGSSPGQFIQPYDIAVDRDFNVYVTDEGNSRVQKFTNAGAFVAAWGGPGALPGQFAQPKGIATDDSGFVYVVEAGNHRVQKFTGDGSFLVAWGGSGAGPGDFLTPAGIAAGPGGVVYVADTGNHRVQRFTSAGLFLGQWGAFGSAAGQFNGPHGLDVDPAGNVHVVDRYNHRVQKFTSLGGYLVRWGVFGAGGGEFFQQPQGIGIGRDGNLYVADANNHRIQRFRLGGPVAGEGTFRYEARLADDGNALLPLAEPARLRIVMQSNGSASSEDNRMPAAQTGLVLVDNLTLTSEAGAVLAPLDFEDGTTGAWTLSAANGSYLTLSNSESAIRDFAPPASTIALRNGFDAADPTCVWTFLSPGDSLASGVFARLESPWIGLADRDSGFTILLTSKLNARTQSRFLRVSTRVKNAGATRPHAHNLPGFIYFGGPGADDASMPLVRARAVYRYPADVINPSPGDSVQIVLEVLDQAERDFTPPGARPRTRLPILDDVVLEQYRVDRDYDGVADRSDACPDDCAAGEDADGDGCVDAHASLRHVESWSGADHPIRFRQSLTGLPAVGDGSERAAVRAGFDAWAVVPGAAVPLLEESPTAQTNAAALDAVNLVTFQDPDLAFPPSVLAVTPTTSFTRRTIFDDRPVLPGQIVDADMIFNPGASFRTATRPGIHDLQSVATHEAGHFCGITHSGVLDATMFFVLQKDRLAASLEDDDRAAIAAAYPDPTLDTDFATVRGTVTHGRTGLPLPGALVTAVRLGGGVPVDTTASDYSREDGSYALYRLPPGNYAVRITPLNGAVGGFPLTPAYISQRLLDIAETVFAAEWWSDPESDRDDPELRGALALAAGETRLGVNIITNVDTIPPAVVAVAPADGTGDVGIDTPILVNFSEPVTTASLQAAFKLRRSGLPGSLGGSGQLLGGTHFVFLPSSPLDFDTEYEIEVTTALADLEGVPAADNFVSAFRTRVRPPLAISDIQPRAAPEGALITIFGSGFDAGVLVAFDFPAECAAFLVEPEVVSPTALTVRVPLCAMTGSVGLTRGFEFSNEFGFTVLPPAPQATALADGPPIALAFAPTDAAVSADGRTVYAVGDGGFVTVDLAAPSRTPVAHNAVRSRSIALTADGGRAVITRPRPAAVVVVDAAPASGTYGQALATVAHPGRPAGVTASADGRRAYVTDEAEGRVHELDVDPASATRWQFLREIPVPGAVLTGGVAVDPTGVRLYLTSANQGLLAVDLGSLEAAVLNPAPTAGGVALPPSGGEVLAPGAQFSPSLQFASAPGPAPLVAGAVPLGGVPRDIGMSPAGQSAFVVNSLLNELHVVDVAPASPTYHTAVTTVATGAGPVAVGVSAASDVLAVANYGSRTLGIYRTDPAATSLVRIVPPVTMPGDRVTVQTLDDTFGTGSVVDLAGATATATTATGLGLGFTVPASPQRATTLTLATAGGGTRSLSLPFTIVDRLAAHPLAGASTFALALPTNPITGGPELGALEVLRTTGDGSLFAVGRNFAAGAVVDFFRASADGSERFGARLATTVLGGVPLVDLAFRPDRAVAYAARAVTGELLVLDSDPASPGFATAIGTPSIAGMGVPAALLADPHGRHLIVGHDGFGGGAVSFLEWGATAFLANVALPQPPASLAATGDGRYLVAGLGGRAAIIDLPSLTLVGFTPQRGPAATVRALAVTGDGRRAVGVLGNTDQIAVWNLDPAAGVVGAELYFGSPGLTAPIESAVPAPNGTGVLLASAASPSLTRLEVGLLPPQVATMAIGQASRRLARSPDGRRLWVADWPASQLGSTLRLFVLTGGSRVALLSGAGQSALTGQPLPQPVRVRLADAAGRPQAGAVVRFALAGPEHGSLDGLPDPVVRRLTGVQGEAQVEWTLGAVPGAMSLAVGVEGQAGVLVVDAQAVLSDAEIVPVVTAVGPADDATGVNAGTSLYVAFNQRLDVTSLIPRFRLAADGDSVPGTFQFVDENRTAIFTPASPLPFGAACAIRVGAGVLDSDGQALADDFLSAFTVQPPPALALHAISPPAAARGTPVVLAGAGFSPTPSANTVLFDGVLAQVASASLTSLVAHVPLAANSGPVRVQVGPAASNELPFTVLAPSAEPGGVAGQLEVAPGASRVAFTPDGSRAYVTSPIGNTVTALDIAGAAVIATIPVGVQPRGIAILPDGSRAYVANFGSHSVSVIDLVPESPTYHEVVATIPVGAGPVDVAVSGVGPMVVVASTIAGAVSLIDAQPGNGTFHQVVSVIATGSGCNSVAISPDATRIYVGTTTGVVMVDLASQVVSVIATGSGCSSVAISPDATILLALLTDGQLLVFDVAPGSPTFNQVVSVIATGSGGSCVAISPDATLAFVTIADGNSMLVFQITKASGASAASFVPGTAVTLTLVATLAVGQGPTAVAADPSGSGLKLVVNGGDGTVTLIATTGVLPPLAMEFRLAPSTINLGALGKWVTGYFEPPPPFTPADIVVGSLRLNGLVGPDADAAPVAGDHDADGRPDLTVKFLRSALALILPEGDRVPVLATGMVGSRAFTADDTVRVRRAKVTAPPQAAVLPPRETYTVRWEKPKNVTAQWVAVLYTLDHGANWPLAATGLPNSGEYLWTTPGVITDSVRVAVVLVENGEPGNPVVTGVLGVSEYFAIQSPLSAGPLPARLELAPVVPNPSPGALRVRFGVPRRMAVEVAAFDVQGRRVRVLAAGERDPGWHEVLWPGDAEGGGPLGTGLYFVRLRAGGETFQERVVLLR